MFGESVTPRGRVFVKICGITNLADALAAIECGADALGFNFFRGSKRYLEVRREADWMASLPERVSKVAVLVNPTWAEATAAAALPFIDALQLHGDESPEFCQRLEEKGIRFAKAVPVGGQALLADVPHFFTEFMMLDTISARGFGGTGETFPWSLGRRFVKGHPDYKVIIAGGLTPHNVADAIRTIRPFGVDVTTGVESAPGRKDLRLLCAFFASVRGCDD
jgi:phosphoribosylanthranilate isomerase